ncbi:MAG: complex I NDUFA9 subunit family protein [Proteobacteria bacterium]|nr:complex I NDUFA9 subunit family protein [Pseudomonadota bacterium]
MTKKIIIFGGSGFIGSLLSNRLLKDKHQVTVICTDEAKALANIGNHKNLKIKSFDIFNEKALAQAIKGKDVVINLIGKLFEAKNGDFERFHHQFPKLLCKQLNSKQKLIHISALGIEESSQSSLYAQTKLAGQQAIIDSCKNYNIIKPSIVFGEKDNFFNLFANMAKISPCLPLIGGGGSKFAPIYVADLVKSIAILVVNDNDYHNQSFEAYGKKEASFKELMQFILKTIGARRILLPLPYNIAKIQAKLMNFVKIYLLTADQVELLKYDNIASGEFENIDRIIGSLSNYETVTPQYLIKKQ